MRSLQVPQNSPLHKKLQSRIESRIHLATRGHDRQHQRWIDAEERTMAYLPETEVDAARRSKRESGEPRYTTIQIPYSYALLMSAHTYWTSVFFARDPIHQFRGRHGEGEMQIQALEALISYQVEVGGMMAPYYIWLYDAGKYSAGILGHYWREEKLHYGQIVDLNGQLHQVTKEIPGYVGNSAFNVSPWDFMHDPRVPLKRFQEGEFCCCRVRLGWHQILQRRAQGYYNDNVNSLKDHLTDKGRILGSTTLVRPEFDMMLSDDDYESSKHPAGATFWEVYVELVPEEWDLGKGLTFPQKWCFTITEDYELVVGATPIGYAHCRFPFDVVESEIEGYGAFVRGIPEIIAPIQNTVDWLVNTHFFNVRASINNQFIIDPSKLVIKDAQDNGPGFVWRLRPEAYGSDLTKIFHQIPVQDVTRNHMSDFQSVLGIGERVLGVNDQIMGALAPDAKRRTATEVRTSTTFGVNRQKTIAEYMSATGFSSHAQKLVQNSQQFYTAEQKLRRVGSYALDAGEQFLTVSPEAIAGFFDFVPIDGTLPADRMAQANLWKEMFASMRFMPPELMQRYDWTRIFAWWAQLSGLRNIRQFEVQVVPDQALAAQAQAGNVVPMGAPQRPAGPPKAPAQAGNASATQAGLNALGPQYPGGPG